MFYICMYILWFLKFWMFFYRALIKTCRYATTAHLISQQCLASISNKSHTFVKKTASCRHHCSLWHEHHHWGIGIPGYMVPSDLRSRPEQSHHLPVALLPLSLLKANSFQWASPSSTVVKWCIGSLFTITFSQYGKKVWYVRKSNPFDTELIYRSPSTECTATSRIQRVKRC